MPHIMEVDKIKDVEKRKATIEIMEKYSKNISLYFFLDLLVEEIGIFFRSSLLKESTSQYQIYPFDKATRIIGTPFPVFHTASSEENIRLQKYCYDLLSFIDFSDYMEMKPEERSVDISIDHNLLALRHNQNKQKIEFKDFREALINEIVGFLNNSDSIIISAYENFIDKSTKLTGEKIQVLKSLISNSFMKHEERTVKLLPTIYINSCLNAYFMSRKDDRYEGNDIDDIWHLSAAIPYCDFIFTERTMNNRIKFEKEIKIKNYFNSVIEYNLDKVIDCISTI